MQDDDAMKLGLLMEAAHAQQTVAQTSLEALKAHMRDLDAVVRDEIRHTLIEELQALGNDSRCAAEALRALKRAANLRSVFWSIGITHSLPGFPRVEGGGSTPPRAKTGAFLPKRDSLAAKVARLEKRGARIDRGRGGGEKGFWGGGDGRAPAYG